MHAPTARVASKASLETVAAAPSAAVVVVVVHAAEAVLHAVAEEAAGAGS